MFRFLFLLFLISCSSSHIASKGGEYSQDEFSYCGKVIQGHIVKIHNKNSTVSKVPSLAVWLYANPSSQTYVLNYVINSKEKLDVEFESRNLFYAVLGYQQQQVEMNLELTLAANSADNAYPHPSFKIVPHNRSLNQWKVYKIGIMGPMFASEYKIVTIPVDQHKKINQNIVHQDFNSQFHEGIYLGEGVRINLGPVDKTKIVVKTPAVTINGVSLPAQVFNFELNLDQIDKASSPRCPTISDMFRWN